jgi:hypothetical protein
MSLLGIRRLRAHSSLQGSSNFGTLASRVNLSNIRNTVKLFTEDPALWERDPTQPQAYRRAAEKAASLLKELGLEPLGDDGSFLQRFRWLTRFEPRRGEESWNVVGRISGRARAQGRPTKTLVLTAHLDNLSADEKAEYLRRDGRDLKDYIGANDNTASVAALFEVVRVLKAAGPFEQDIVVVLPSAEEDGLKGTEAFYQSGLVKREDVLAHLNLEMIGGSEFPDLLVYAGDTKAQTEASSSFHLAMSLAKQLGLKVKPGLKGDDGEKWNSRSDHRVAQAAGIDGLMLHGRATRGTYHFRKDRPEALNFEKVHRAAKLFVELSRAIADDATFVPSHPPVEANLNPFPGWVRVP